VEAADFLCEVGRPSTNRCSSRPDERRATDFLLQHLSVTVQRGNAACVLYLAALTTELTSTLSIDSWLGGAYVLMTHNVL